MFKSDRVLVQRPGTTIGDSCGPDRRVGVVGQWRAGQDDRIDATHALLAATAVHAGFQLTVTAVAYPALTATGAREWAAVHAAHSRRITPVVAFVHGSLLLACGWALATLPVTPWFLTALAGTALALAVTAGAAAPTHARLGRLGPRPDLLRRLVRADAVRTAGAVLGFAGALGVVG